MIHRSLDDEFAAFAARFVRTYWDEVVSNPYEFGEHDDPVSESLEELLNEVTFQTWAEPRAGAPNQRLFLLRMSRQARDNWTFSFLRSATAWSLIAATSGSPENHARVDLLDLVYSRSFGPFLERVVRKAH